MAVKTARIIPPWRHLRNRIIPRTVCEQRDKRIPVEVENGASVYAHKLANVIGTRYVASLSDYLIEDDRQTWTEVDERFSIYGENDLVGQGLLEHLEGVEAAIGAHEHDDNIGLPSLEKRILFILDKLSPKREILNPNQGESLFYENLDYLEQLAQMKDHGIDFPRALIKSFNSLSDEERLIYYTANEMFKANKPSVEVSRYLKYEFCKNVEIKTLAQKMSDVTGNQSLKCYVLDFLEERNDAKSKQFIANLIVLGSKNNYQKMTVEGVDRLFESVYEIHNQLRDMPDRHHGRCFYEEASGHYFEAKKALDLMNEGNIIWALEITTIECLESLLKKIPPYHGPLTHKHGYLMGDDNVKTEIDILMTTPMCVTKLIEVKKSKKASGLTSELQAKRQNDIAIRYGLGLEKIIG
jgi:hypothetical protein